MTPFKVGDKGIYHLPAEGSQAAMDVQAEIVKVHEHAFSTYELQLTMPDGTTKTEHHLKHGQFEVQA
jgi:hypothetical protein